jgi:hypothetical protein
MDGDMSVERLAARIRGEYLEMPGLRLTLSQAQRLFGLDAALCSRVFDVLTRDGLLSQGADNHFGR